MQETAMASCRDKRQTDAVEASEELRRVVERFIAAAREGDDQAVMNRFSRQRGFERIGSDPAEWWRDGEAAALVWAQQMREMGGGFPFHLVDDVHAMVEGTVGWAGARLEIDAPTGTFVYRMSMVLHLEHGDWKIVHHHTSVPFSNEEGGFFLSTSVEEIAEAVNASRPDLSATSAPDGTVTIVFTDIEDSTRLNDVLGDKRWMDVLRAHNDIIRVITNDHGGSVVKNQGDGFMLAFASARRALHAARAIQDAVEERFDAPGSVIRVRIGIHVGEAVRESDDLFGHAVSYAARVASVASGAETVVSSLVRELVVQTGEFEFGEPRDAELKGLSGHHRVYPLE